MYWTNVMVILGAWSVGFRWLNSKSSGAPKKLCFLALCSKIYVQFDFQRNQIFWKWFFFNRAMFCVTSLGIVQSVCIVHMVIFVIIFFLRISFCELWKILLMTSLKMLKTLCHFFTQLKKVNYEKSKNTLIVLKKRWLWCFWIFYDYIFFITQASNFFMIFLGEKPNFSEKLLCHYKMFDWTKKKKEKIMSSMLQKRSAWYFWILLMHLFLNHFCEMLRSFYYFGIFHENFGKFWNGFMHVYSTCSFFIKNFLVHFLRMSLCELSMSTTIIILNWLYNFKFICNACCLMCDAWCARSIFWKSWLFESRGDQKYPIWVVSGHLSDIPKSTPGGSHMYTLSWQFFCQENNKISQKSSE